MIEVQIQEKAFSGHGNQQSVLRDVLFSLGDAEVLGLYGPSGCGKTTLLRIVAGLDRDYRGQVVLDGTPIIRPTPAVGLVSQRPVSYEWLSVADNIAFGARYLRNGNRPLDPLDEAARIGRLVGLSAQDLAKYPAEISGGMTQRMAFARALLANPKVLLLDEPFSALDFESRSDLQDAVIRARTELGTAFILVSHDPEEILYLSSRILLLSATPARVVREDTPNLPAHGRPDARYTPEFQLAKRTLRDWLAQQARS